MMDDPTKLRTARLYAKEHSLINCGLDCEDCWKPKTEFGCEEYNIYQGWLAGAEYERKQHLRVLSATSSFPFEP